jgi:hypothetical protein
VCEFVFIVLFVPASQTYQAGVWLVTQAGRQNGGEVKQTRRGRMQKETAAMQSCTAADAKAGISGRVACVKSEA